MIEIITWVAVILQAIGSTAIVLKKVCAWPIWICSAGTLVYINIKLKSYSQACLWVFFLILDIWGWYRWGKEKCQGGSV